ncbi:MAG: hypothetical protein AVDCRST_MAG54-4473, partial [uncultured Actinomycetospora sp.]
GRPAHDRARPRRRHDRHGRRAPRAGGGAGRAVALVVPEPGPL